MKNIKKVITAATLTMVLMVGTSFGGVIVTDAQQPQPCNAETNISKIGTIILSDIIGVIVTDLTGVIVTDANDRTDCGVIVTD